MAMIGCASNISCRCAMFRSALRQQGLGLVSAIFLIVVVAVIVAAITRMVRSSSEVFAQDVVSHRAFLAAETGSQLGLNRLFAPAGVGSCSSWSWDLSAFGLAQQLGIPRCSATVSCRSELVGGESTFTLESAGRCDVGVHVSERSVLVRAQP